ncbi:MAG: helix-turn-helix transcriptional regulator [Vulcanimicrobiaceae bacterium]
MQREAISTLDGVADSALLTLYDCGRILGCGYDLARALANRGGLPSIRVSPKNIRVRASDLRAYIDSHVRGRHREPLFPPQRAHRASTT